MSPESSSFPRHQIVSLPAAKLLSRIRHFFESGNFRPWFAAVVVCLFLLGVWLRFSIPQIPITNKDSGGYINPALALLVKGFYEPSCRNFPYAGFVWILLKTTGTFTSIAIAQHLLGLAGGIIFWLTWLRLRIFLPPDWRITAAHAVLGVALVWGLLLSRHPVFFEHSMRPEAIYPFWIGLHLFGAASFLESALIRKSLPLSIWWGGFMTTVSIGLYVLKPIWGLAVISGGLPFLIVLLRARGKWRIIPVAAGAVGVAAGFALFIFPESALSSSRPQPVSLINQQLFFVHANFVERELRRDLAAPDPLPFPREIILSTAEEFRSGFSHKFEKPYRTLGFDPDNFMYGPVNTHAVEFFRNQPGGVNRFFRHYYIRAWIGQPFQMAWKIIRELGVIYRFDPKLTRAEVTIKLGTYYREANTLFASPNYLMPYREWGPLKNYMESLHDVVAGDPPYRWSLTMTFLSLVNSSYFVVLLLFIIAGTIRGRKSNPAPGGIPILWLGLWLFSYNFGITLTVAIVHSMSIQRYTDTQFCVTLFSYCAGVLLLFSMLVAATDEISARKMARGIT